MTPFKLRSVVETPPTDIIGSLVHDQQGFGAGSEPGSWNKARIFLSVKAHPHWIPALGGGAIKCDAIKMGRVIMVDWVCWSLGGSLIPQLLLTTLLHRLWLQTNLY